MMMVWTFQEEPNKPEEKPVVVSHQSQSSRFAQSSDVRSQQQYQHQHSTGPTSGHRAVSASYMSSGDSPMSAHHSSHARNGGGNNSSANGSVNQRKQGVVEKLLVSKQQVVDLYIMSCRPRYIRSGRWP